LDLKLRALRDLRGLISRLNYLLAGFQKRFLARIVPYGNTYRQSLASCRLKFLSKVSISNPVVLTAVYGDKYL
jgi:hypothetical protein